MEKTDTEHLNGSTPAQPSLDEQLMAAMAEFNTALIQSSTNGNLQFEFDPAALVTHVRLMHIHLQALIKLLNATAQGPFLHTLNAEFLHLIQSETQKLRAPMIARSVGSIIRS